MVLHNYYAINALQKDSVCWKLLLCSILKPLDLSIYYKIKDVPTYVT